jgi:hypothetical protein
MKRFTKIGLVACSSVLFIGLGLMTSSRAAGPPAGTNVNVVNTPLPVSNNPATPVQFMRGSGSLASFYGFSYPVPAGNRLVVESISGFCESEIDSDRVPIPEFSTIAGGTEVFHVLAVVPAGATPVSPTGVIHNFAFSLQTRVCADPGTEVLTNFLGTNCRFTFSGYLT